MTELNRFKQILLSERLFVRNSIAPLHRLHRIWNVTMSGDEDDRQLSFGTCQLRCSSSRLAGSRTSKHQASGSFWTSPREIRSPNE